jgi:transaldolase
MNQFEALSQYTKIVIDTGDFNKIMALSPQEATTNPSLILKAIKNPEYAYILKSESINNSINSPSEKLDHLIVFFGCEILKRIPGRVSTEVDARASFSTEETIQRAKRIIERYKESGILKERILIKIAATWEGIQAAKVLQSEGINCNLTLLFSIQQAVACAQAKVKLISPFVGRVYDWHKRAMGAQWNEGQFEGPKDPGVRFVQEIYLYFKKFKFSTEIMGASFRNISQIQHLAGCDLLTISPELLHELQQLNLPLPRALSPEMADSMEIKEISLNESEFRLAMNTNEMANDKLSQGIRSFCQDTLELEALLSN